MRSALAKYNALLTRAPFLTNASTGLFVAAVGDVACQLFFEHGKPYSARRTVEMGLIRALFMSPFLSVYFPWLSRFVPGTTGPQVVKRVVADQIIGSPFAISVTFCLAALLQGAPETIAPRIQHQLLPTWLAGVSFWPFIHCINFKFAPVHHQPLVAHVASLWWNAVLSFRANIPVTEARADGEQGAAVDSIPAATSKNDVAVPESQEGLATVFLDQSVSTEKELR